VKKIFQLLKERVKSFNPKKDNRPVIMLICIIISMVLWFANSLGKKYESTVSIPIQYTNLPEDKILLNAPPKALQVRMEAYGATLLQHKIRLMVNPINFNVSLFTEDSFSESNYNELRINTNKYLPQITRQISGEINVIDISPDSLKFEFDDIVSEMKKVVDDFEMSFEKQYYLSGSVIFNPDSVLVKGPKKTIDTLGAITTRHYKFRDLNSSAQKNVRLKEINNLKIETRKVSALIPVSLFTEYTEDIPLKKFNVPDSLILVTFPGRISVKCLVSIDDYNSLSPSNFIIGVDYNKISANSNKVEIDVREMPSYIKSFQVNRTEVEYILEKKEND
jgi:hypothetical protein